MNFSPDGQYQVESIWASEIRFGPEYSYFNQICDTRPHSCLLGTA
jgi:hypothetical protein